MTDTERISRRIRHELRFRLLQVKQVQQLRPRMLRVTLAGDELEGFASAAHDDHVKLFFPEPGQLKPPLPVATPEGMSFPNGRPQARDYTPRRYDAAAGELDIDFALHEAGPATAWALQAKPGDWLGVGGPRGSFVLEKSFDWYLLAGDETALPAIARRLEELPAGARALVVAEVDEAAEELDLHSAATLALHWVHRGAGASLREAVAALQLPPGEGYAWVACESDTARQLRQLLVEERGLPKNRVKAAGYWKRGAAATHESHDD
ncbi:siderophore-interacting protein [Azoarcus sp. TTM-91]|uniref:siderophore-interacting protein n=1 Tax=Azoarcus sp. TTM-91 TaxID=2691581 RepID=UPI00145ED47B|nr:siderophore-interacting protein [Azoarcus sp. TTM-91]NMG37260.1 siderophore-interacting protein [Azoarcus sp. TTM-91]